MIGKPSKTSQRVARAMEVQTHYIGGMRAGDIATLMSVSERTVWNDLKLARHLNREEVQAFHHEELLGKRLKVFRLIRTNALRDYQLCKEGGNAKAAFLNIALRAEEKITQLLQDVGALIKVPERVSIEEGNPFQDQEFRAKYTKLLLEARKRGLPINGL
jgi:predicted DNA-binding protein (UPF0251 family)